MKIVLANCPPWTEKTPPLHLGYLTAYLRAKGHDVIPFDFNIEAYIRSGPEEKYIWSRDLDGRWIRDKSSFLRREINRWTNAVIKTGAAAVGISVFYDSRHICIEFAKEIKRRNTKIMVIFGGPQCHRGFICDELLNEKSADAYVTGEGEETLNQLLMQLEKYGRVAKCRGAIIRNGKDLSDCGDRAPLADLDSIPFPDYSDLPVEKYAKPNMIALLGSRGCISHCAFCQDPNNVKKYRSRSGRNIFREFRLRYDQGYREFYFNDLAMNGDIAALAELCDMIIQDGGLKSINIGGQMKCRPEMTREIYGKLRQAGCHQIMFGVESGSQKILNAMRKAITVKSIEKNLRYCTEAGIKAEVALIVGFPGETEDTFSETIRLIENNFRHIDTIAALYALDLRRGSDIANDLEKYGIVRESDEWYWHTKDGKNTFEWRLSLIYRVIKAANRLGIKLGFDDAHFYFYHAVRYFHLYKKDYTKSFEVMEDALQYLSTKIKALEKKVTVKEEVGKRLRGVIELRNEEMHRTRDGRKN
ncbi:MAG: radical SAM protein [archaeon]